MAEQGPETNATSRIDVNVLGISLTLTTDDVVGLDSTGTADTWLSFFRGGQQGFAH